MFHNSRLLYSCLVKYILVESRINITIWKGNFHVMIDNDDTVYPSEPLLLNIFIGESHIDTNSTPSTIVTKLISLNNFIETI